MQKQYNSPLLYMTTCFSCPDYRTRSICCVWLDNWHHMRNTQWGLSPPKKNHVSITKHEKLASQFIFLKFLS